ncbi:Cell wall-associated hydrolase, NlpC family [Jatrophihabitans endophyticus]|uniref:Cell wall-associated hydrolase, NlpC family n=1 Tax=Jatrophihabitans endophyticus TaxID=1206085 RepID=A0A1M5L3G1_9ACTN|nr:C40 family peptidase [Jatrophihabitans endophyticus]SHG59485.1 Cell wall-associated hydrolase, NlpC family [Jatrophihabitans endophyticus]
MAIRFMHRARPAIVVAALAATTVVAPTLASASPSAPRREPSIADVQKQLGHLAEQNSQLVERYNQARVNVAKRDKAAARAKTAETTARTTYRSARLAFAQNVQAQYQAGSLGAAGALLDSNSGPNYLDRLETLGMISSYDSDLVTRLESARTQAETQADRARTALAAARKERDGIAGKRDAVTKQIDKYKDLLSTLNAKQRARFQRSSSPSVATSKIKDLPGAGTAAAKKAVAFALDQVGEPYVFGAAGPSSWDCSGLTMGAWQAGGVSLPHSAADQFNYGKHVGLDSLSPGDLIFMYQPIGHVTIYIGDGMMVSAPTEGQPVEVVPVSSFSSDIVGATHLG